MEPTFKNLRTLCILAAPAALAMAGLAGCTDPGPLDDDQPRTPFSRYDELRGNDPPLTKENALGETQPNLRGRWLDDNR